MKNKHIHQKEIKPPLFVASIALQIFIRGASRIFIYGGGGAQTLCAGTHISSAKPEVPSKFKLPPGSRTRLRALEALGLGGGGLILSLVLSEPYFFHILI